MMVEKKKKNRLIPIILIPVCVVLLLIVYPWLPLYIGIMLSPGDPTPVNTYGEFPFHIVYEVDGERIEVNDVFVVEYAGREINDLMGKYLKWDCDVESGTMLIRPLFTSMPDPGDEVEYGYGFMLLDHVDTGDAIGRIYVDLGSAPYYMGYYVLDGYSPGSAYINGQGVIDDEALWDQYKIKIIETSFSEPMIGNGIGRVAD